MKRLQIFKLIWVIGLLGLSLCTQACQQTTADPGNSLEKPSGSQKSGSGRSGPQSIENPSSSAKNEEPREVIYIAEKIDPIAAKLSSQDSNSRINVRSQPSIRSKAQHFGYQGDPVTLLKQAKGEGDVTWYYLRFDKSQAEGWIREDFIAKSSPTKLRPKQDYLSLSLETDPWISSFNTSYDKAIQTNEPWLFKPSTVALKLLGYPNTDGCKPTEVSSIEQSPDLVTVIIRNGPEQVLPCSGDSVLASETRVDLVKQKQIWAVDWVGGRYRCHEGRGQQDFAPARCS